jgi:hypothetical protein
MGADDGAHEGRQLCGHASKTSLATVIADMALGQPA